MRDFFAIASTALCALAASTAVAQTCPPAGFSAKAVFNPTKFFDGRWYTIKQIPVAFQPENDLFCVTANYKIETTNVCKILRCNDQVVRVTNGANTDSATGARKSANLHGLIKDPTKPAEVSVGPPFLPSILYGPYWVIEAGSVDELLEGKTEFTGENYEWAIITGGAPEVATAGGCLPGQGAANSGGFWLFSRSAELSQEATDKLVAVAASKGLDATALKTVGQTGCTYV